MGLGSRAAKVALALLVVVTLGGFVFAEGGSTKVTAYFAQFKGIYVGDDVTALGVPIGTVTSVTPEKDRVKVELELDGDYAVPADVKAAVVAPSLVSVRSIVLGPVGGGGPRLEDGAEIPLSRTAIPVEWDDIKDQLVQLSTALGPKGSNDKGATSELISSAAGFLDGNGQTMNDTLTNVSEAMSTLADNSGDLFATVRNLQVFVAAIKDSDAQVRAFNIKLAQVAAILEVDRKSLSGALDGLQKAFTSLDSFLRKNKDLTVDTLKELRTTTSLLADDRQQIADLLQVAPTALSNFYNILDPRGENGNLITGALAINNLQAPAQIVCGALLAAGGNATDCQNALTPLLKYFALNAPPLGIGGVTNNGGGAGGVIEPGTPDTKGATSTPETTEQTDQADLIAQLLGGL